MVNGRYASLTVPFGSMANSSNVLFDDDGNDDDDDDDIGVERFC